MKAKLKLTCRTLFIQPKIRTILKRGQMLRKFAGKVSRKTKYRWISEKWTTHGSDWKFWKFREESYGIDISYNKFPKISVDRASLSSFPDILEMLFHSYYSTIRVLCVTVAIKLFFFTGNFLKFELEFLIERKALTISLKYPREIGTKL